MLVKISLNVCSKTVFVTVLKLFVTASQIFCKYNFLEYVFIYQSCTKKNNKQTLECSEIPLVEISEKCFESTLPPVLEILYLFATANSFFLVHTYVPALYGVKENYTKVKEYLLTK